MQTYLVHTRRPLHLLRTTGPLGFLGFIFFIGGTVAAGLFNPLFWMLYVIWLVAVSGGFDPVFPEPLLFLSLFNLLAGNGAFIFLLMLAPIRRGWLGLIPYSLTAMAYWVLISVAAYRGLWQLLNNPFYWEKTRHGVSKHGSSVATALPERRCDPRFASRFGRPPRVCRRPLLISFCHLGGTRSGRCGDIVGKRDRRWRWRHVDR